MQKSLKAIVWFEEVGRQDIALVGGKGANLGEMTQAKIPVPPGFIVTADAYYDFIQTNNLASKITSALLDLDTNDSKKLQMASAQIKQDILDAPMPQETAKAIEEAYFKMGSGLVAVRSSATAEDLPEASFAGQQSTFLNIENSQNVIQSVQKCWASLFESRAIYYRDQQKYDHLKVGIAVPVQRMVASEASGVMFTVEPLTSDTNKIVIEAIYGLGEGIVSGEVTPDLFIIDKQNTTILSRKISLQDKKLIRNTSADSDNPNIWVAVSGAREKQKIADSEVIKLAEIAKLLENHYGSPQDIEWAAEGGKIYIVQTRPVTTINNAFEVEPEIDAPFLLAGDAASPGFASGPVKILLDPANIDQVVDGDILVAEMTTPDFVPAMKRAVAIVTDRGGRTSHAAIVSRELGTPCVVGTGEATKVLTDGQIVTVDGSHGKVYSGKVSRNVQGPSVTSMVQDIIKTRTRVYVNLAQPELADKIAARNVDGVGLLRAEFIVSQIGMHPLYMIKNNLQENYIQKLYDGILPFAKAFYPRPVVYRTTDFKTNEYRELTGGTEFEHLEENPMIGYRGASRYITDTESFRLEIEAIKRVRQQYNNLCVMIPFVRTVEELRKTKELMEEFGLKRSDDFKLWMMTEIPANIFIMEKFLEVGIDGISIGSNDLTQLTLGIDRDSSKLADTFDERNEAVLVALERAITTAKKMGVTSSICGQAPSVYPELTEKLVSWGITSVSVSPDMIGATRAIIARAETKLKIS
ncbi:MAG: phosphoenolpyruvate synthase [Dehalococcoidia bacterium]|nr:phosphoenolpyruvate synthase [Dehalococcoidia bacterium]